MIILVTSNIVKWVLPEHLLKRSHCINPQNQHVSCWTSLNGPPVIAMYVTSRGGSRLLSKARFLIWRCSQLHSKAFWAFWVILNKWISLATVACLRSFCGDGDPDAPDHPESALTSQRSPLTSCDANSTPPPLPLSTDYHRYDSFASCLSLHHHLALRFDILTSDFPFSGNTLSRVCINPASSADASFILHLLEWLQLR